MNSQVAGRVEKQGSILPQAAATSTTQNSEKEDIYTGISTAAMATIQDDDERLLTRIGYKQVDPTVTSNSPWPAGNESRV